MVYLKKAPHLPCQQLASAPGVNLFIEYLTPDWFECKWPPVSGNIGSYYVLTRRLDKLERYLQNSANRLLAGL